MYMYTYIYIYVYVFVYWFIQSMMCASICRVRCRVINMLSLIHPRTRLRQVEMLRMAGRGVAVGDAKPPAKEAADLLVAPSTEAVRGPGMVVDSIITNIRVTVWIRDLRYGSKRRW